MADLDPVEADSRFPSGNWLGFFLDQRVPGASKEHRLEVAAEFGESSEKPS